MKTINPNVYPKGGYTFTDSDGSRHPADSWAGVIVRVKRYRRRQHRPEGNVMEEVIAQACANNPGFCSEVSEANKEHLKRASLKSRILLWLHRIHERMKREPFTFVSDSLHAARVDVCTRCPKNTGLQEGCGSCRAALKALAEGVIGSRSLDARVTACSVLAEHIPVSSWLDQTAVANPELPGECWRKRTL